MDQRIKRERLPDYRLAEYAARRRPFLGADKGAGSEQGGP